MRTPALILVVAVAAIVATKSDAAGAEQPRVDRGADIKTISLPPDVQSALYRNITTLKAFSFHCLYALQRKNANAKPASVDPQPTLFEETAYGVLNDGKFFYRWGRPTNGTTNKASSYQEIAFDGRIFYSGVVPIKNDVAGTPMVHKFLGDNSNDKQAISTVVSVPYLEAAGISIPGTIAEWSKNGVDSVVLKCVKTGTLQSLSEKSSLLTLRFDVPDETIIVAKECDLEKLAETMLHTSSPESVASYIDKYKHVRTLTPIRHITLTLDREKGFAITHREERTFGGDLIRTIDCEEFRSYDEGKIWLPRICTIRTYLKLPHLLAGFSNEPCEEKTLKLETASFDVSKDDVQYELKYGPRSVIVDRASTDAAQSSEGKILFQSP